jgi:hypothetical protein
MIRILGVKENRLDEDRIRDIISSMSAMISSERHYEGLYRI